MGMGFMTWLVVFGNSVRIGTERTITVIHQSVPPRVRNRRRTSIAGRFLVRSFQQPTAV